jgi:hypothetical protein
LQFEICIPTYFYLSNADGVLSALFIHALCQIGFVRTLCTLGVSPTKKKRMFTLS